MDDPLPMRLTQCVGDLDSVAQELVERQRSALEALRQGLAFHALHHQEVHAVLMPDVVQRADVRMIQTRDCLGLALEALAPFGIAGEVCGQDFDRHCSIQPRVARPVNFSHPARAQRRDDLVGTQFCAIRQGHSWERL